MPTDSTFYVLLLICGCVVVLSVLYAWGVAAFMTPLGVFSLVFSFVYFFVPLLQAWFNVGRFTYFTFADRPEDAAVGAVLYSSGYFLVAFVVGLFASRRVDLEKLRTALLRSNPSADRLVLIPLLMVFAIGLVASTMTVGPMVVGDFGAFMRNRITLLAGLGYVIRPIQLSTPILLLLFAFAYRARMTGGRVGLPVTLMILVGVVSVAANLTLGSRSSAAISILYVVLPAYVISRRTFRVKQIVALALTLAIGFYGIALLGAYRRDISGGGTAASRWWQVVQDSTPWVATAREFALSFGQAELFAFVLDHPNYWSFRWGATYLAGALMPIPRVIWPGKPLGAGPYVSNIVTPGAYSVGGSENTSLTSGTPLEAYLNFGPMGIVLVAILHGLGIGAVSRLGVRVRGAVGVTVYVILLFTVSQELVHGEFAGSAARAGVMLVPVILLAATLRLLKVRPDIRGERGISHAESGRTGRRRRFASTGQAH